MPPSELEDVMLSFSCMDCGSPLVLEPSLLEVIAVDREKHGDSSPATVVSGGPTTESPAVGQSRFDNDAFVWLRTALRQRNHPLCALCARNALSLAHTKASDAAEIAGDYSASHQRLIQSVEEAELLAGPRSGSDLATPVSGVAHDQFQAVRNRCVRLQERRRALVRRRQLLAQRTEQVDAHARRYWQLSNALLAQAQAVAGARAQTQRTARRHHDRATALAGTVVLADGLHIWHSGHFGTIGGLRLGRLPAVPVAWTEINAAWGLTVLLVQRLAEAVRAPPFDKNRLRLAFRGSFSRITVDGTDHELHGSSDMSLGRLFWYRRFDLGMVAFLQCVKQLADHCSASAALIGEARKRGPGLKQSQTVVNANSDGAIAAAAAVGTHDDHPPAALAERTNSGSSLAAAAASPQSERKQTGRPRADAQIFSGTGSDRSISPSPVRVVEVLPTPFQLPYPIDKDRVGDCSIKARFNTDENWTKALKYLLTDLKWMLVWITSQQAQISKLGPSTARRKLFS